MTDASKHMQADGDDELGPMTDAVLQHPRFEQAVAAYVPRVIAWRRRMGVFNRVGTTLGLHICHFVAYLHFANRAGQEEHGATFSKVLEICERRQQCGSRALRTTLSVLRVMGYLHASKSPTDGRVQVFVPSQKLTREMIDGFALSLSVLDSLEPGCGHVERMQTDEIFLTDVVFKSGHAVVMGGVDITEVFPDLHAIIMKAGGFPTSITVADAELRGVEVPPTRAIAREFSLSQSQVRGVLAELASRGLVERGEEGKIVSADRLANVHKALIARELALHLKCTFGRDAADPFAD